MSIYCTIFDIGDDHTRRCKRMQKIHPGEYTVDDSQPCTCGNSPIEYQGRHVLPSDHDKRSGVFDLAAIPDHITRDGRDDRPENGKWYPWLRVGLFRGNHGTVLLTRKQVACLTIIQECGTLVGAFLKADRSRRIQQNLPGVPLLKNQKWFTTRNDDPETSA